MDKKVFVLRHRQLIEAISLDDVVVVVEQLSI